MSKPISMFFAVTGTLLLLLVGFSFGMHSPWLVLLSITAAIGFIGFGFVLKARMSRKNY